MTRRMCCRSAVALKGGGGGAVPLRAIGVGRGVGVEGGGVPLTTATAWQSRCGLLKQEAYLGFALVAY
jgi:hypothetical protein